MNKIIFTEEFCQPENLHPFTLTRQMQDIRIGILTIREKWEKALSLPSFDKKEDDYIDLFRSVNIEDVIGKDVCFIIHGNVLPSSKLVKTVKRLKNGECIATQSGDSIIFRISKNEIADKHNIKVGRAISFNEEVKVIRYPWDIFQLNDWAIRQDFELLTRKRKSQTISKTNKIIKPSQLFIEKCCYRAGVYW